MLRYFVIAVAIALAAPVPVQSAELNPNVWHLGPRPDAKAKHVPLSKPKTLEPKKLAPKFDSRAVYDDYTVGVLADNGEALTVTIVEQALHSMKVTISVVATKSPYDGVLSWWVLPTSGGSIGEAIAKGRSNVINGMLSVAF